MRNKSVSFLTFMTFFGIVLLYLPAIMLPVTASETMRAIEVKIAADKEFRGQERWREMISTWISSISDEFERKFDIRFSIKSFEEWESCCPEVSLEELFHDLKRKIPLGSSDIVLGFTDRSDLSTSKMGLASYLNGYALIKRGVSIIQTEHYLLHEICHLFGGVDLRRTPSIMHWNQPIHTFDTATKKLIQVNKYRRFNPNLFPLTGDSIDEAISVYEDIPAADHQDEAISLILATLLLEKEDYKSMISLCKKARNLFPDSMEISNLLGIAYRRTGSIDLAINEYLTVIQKQPWLPEAHYNLGIAYEKKGLLSKSEDAYLKSIELDPHFAKSHANLAFVYLEMKQPEKAVIESQIALSLFPELAQAHSILGGALLLLGRLDEAERSSRQALALDPELPGALNNLGTIYLKQHKMESAQEMYEHAVKIKPDHHQALYNLGRVHYLKGSYEIAIDHFLKVIKIEPEHFPSHTNLGLSYLQTENFDAAEKSCLTALKLKPDHAPAYSALSYVYFVQENWIPAEETALKTLSLSPSLPEAHNLLGIIYEKQKKTDQAEKAYLKALMIKDDYLEAQMNLANLYFNKNQLTNALAGYQKVLDIDPHQTQAWNNAAVVLYLEGKYQEAWDFLQEAIRHGFQPDPDFIDQVKKKIRSNHELSFC